MRRLLSIAAICLLLPTLGLSHPFAVIRVSQSGINPPVTVSLDASLSGDSDAPITSYVWTSSDGQTAVGLVASMVFGKSGLYSITLTVTDAAGNRSTAQTTIVVGADTLGPPKPSPSLSAISPSSALAGSLPIGVTLTGENFVPASVVQVNGVSAPTTFVNSTTLSATIPAAALQSAGFALVTVFTPEPGGGQSSAQQLFINNPVPTVTSISPAIMFMGESRRLLTIRGTGFVSTSAAFINGILRSSTVINPFVMTTVLTEADVSSPGSLDIKVSNGIPGGGNSEARAATVVLRSPTAVLPFVTGSAGLVAMTTTGSEPLPSSAYGMVRTDDANTVPAGFAIVSSRQNGVLVSETSIPVSQPIRSGRVFAETDEAVNTAIAVVNPQSTPVTITYFFTDTNGQDFGSGAITLPPKQQLAKFLTELPFAAPASFTGTFSFAVSQPVGAVALRQRINERGESLLSALPVADLEASNVGPVTVPYFADGSGWSTQLLLLNPTSQAISGTFQVPGTDTSSNSTYSIAPRSSLKLAGAVTITPDTNSVPPSAVALFSYQAGDMTVSEAALPASRASNLHLIYFEAAGTTLAVANPAATTASVLVDAFDAAGNPIGNRASIAVPPHGHIAMPVSRIPGLESLDPAFRGLLRLSFPPLLQGNVAAAALRSKYNERGEPLLTPMPAAPGLIIPDFVSGGGYASQFVLFNNRMTGETSNGVVEFVSPQGSSTSFSFQ